MKLKTTRTKDDFLTYKIYSGLSWDLSEISNISFNYTKLQTIMKKTYKENKKNIFHGRKHSMKIKKLVNHWIGLYNQNDLSFEELLQALESNLNITPEKMKKDLLFIDYNYGLMAEKLFDNLTFISRNNIKSENIFNPFVKQHIMNTIVKNLDKLIVKEDDKVLIHNIPILFEDIISEHIELSHYQLNKKKQLSPMIIEGRKVDKAIPIEKSLTFFISLNTFLEEEYDYLNKNDNDFFNRCYSEKFQKKKESDRKRKAPTNESKSYQ